MLLRGGETVTGMDFYIRPRQDFSLSRMADAMRCLHCRGLYPALCVLEEKKKHVIVIRIEAVGDRKQLTEKAIKTLIDMEHFTESNFKIIELSPAEVAVTEVF